YRRELQQAEADGKDVDAYRQELSDQYTNDVASPFLAAERGELDNVLEPAGTRLAIIKALRGLRGKRVEGPTKKHGNIPL
ncbi:MAG: carboxyl transferase domain-containing protein, partial [Canibacter sp.]